MPHALDIAPATGRLGILTPGMGAVASTAYAGVIAARCGAALVVARRHQSRLGAMHQLVSRLKDSPAQLAGVVINEY